MTQGFVSSCVAASLHVVAIRQPDFAKLAQQVWFKEKMPTRFDAVNITKCSGEAQAPKSRLGVG
jgi:hypothetical protein